MFLLSGLLIFISSYLLTSFFSKNSKNNLGIIYFFLIAFSQIILSFEILSLLNLISPKPFIICNGVILAAAVIFWIVKRFPLYKPKMITEFKNILKALKRDRLLIFLSLCFIVFIVSEFLIARYNPVIFGDALSYYFPRVTAWLQNGNINHFITPDTRELIMPVNLEFLYMWALMFTKSDFGLALFPYTGFLFLLYVTYNFLGELGFSRRKRLWSVFVISSFIVLAVMSYTPCADVLIGALLLASLYLFYVYLKYDDKISIYFSTLCTALAVGIKTTAIIAFPSVFILLIITALLFKKEKLKKGLILYIFFLFINFMIFSSYNYILNIIQFHNPVSCPEQFLLNKFRGGFKGYLCNLIKYIFTFFDISAIKNINSYHYFITALQEKVLNLIGESSLSYKSEYFDGTFNYDYDFTVAKCGLGAVGILTFIPSFFRSIVKGFKKNSSPKYKLLAALALSLAFNILIFSRVMLFTTFNLRYIVTFIVISIPIVVISYIRSNKNLFKWIIVYFMFVYLFLVAHTQPVSIFLFYHKYKTVHPEVKNIESIMSIQGEEPDIFDYFIKKDKSKIAVFSFRHEEAIFHILKLRLHGFILDRLLVENIEDYDLNNYDYIISSKNSYSSSNIMKTNSKYCLYLDWKKQVTDNLDEAAAVQCMVPFDYLVKKGFKPVDDVKFNNYLILKREI